MSTHRKTICADTQSIQIQNRKILFLNSPVASKMCGGYKYQQGHTKFKTLPLYRFSKNSNGINKCANTKGFAIAENVSTITSKNTKLFLKHCVHVHNHSHTCNSYTKV